MYLQETKSVNECRYSVSQPFNFALVVMSAQSVPGLDTEPQTLFASERLLVLKNVPKRINKVLINILL